MVSPLPLKIISILLIDSRDSSFASDCLWCFLLDALQFLIRIVGRDFLDWNCSIAHRRSGAPRRELNREPLATNSAKALNQS
jgi:hypothetical protein